MCVCVPVCVGGCLYMHAGACLCTYVCIGNNFSNFFFMLQDETPDFMVENIQDQLGELRKIVFKFFHDLLGESEKILNV